MRNAGEPDENRPGATGKKPRLSGPGIAIAAYAFIGLMGSMALFTRGLYAFHQGANETGIAHMVLTAAFPLGMVIGAWWMERESGSGEGEADRDDGERQSG